jgi:hypothetical protein
MRVLRRIFRPKREIEQIMRCKKKSHNEELVLLSKYYSDHQTG